MIRVIDSKGKPRFLVEKLANDEGYMKRMGFQVQHLEEKAAPEIELPILENDLIAIELDTISQEIKPVEFNEEINEQLDLLAEEVKPVLKRGRKPNQTK